MSSVVELFGNPVTAALSEWRNIVTEQRCPYIGSRCYKVRKSANRRVHRRLRRELRTAR